MTNLDIIRAWKDEEYWFSLSDAQRAMIPEHPAGGMELPEEPLAEIYFPEATGEATQCGPWYGP